MFSQHISSQISKQEDLVIVEDEALDESEASNMPLSWGESVRHRLEKLAVEAEDAYYNTGICVYDLTGDSLLFEYNQHKVMRPASTQKLLTAISALSLLGADYQYRTRAYYTGKILSDSILNGNIYVVGDFDPAFDTDDLKSLAKSISELGIKKINGKIYGDVSMKDSLILGEGWCWDDIPSLDEPYLSPLIFNRGCATVEMVNRKPELSVPSSYITLVNKTGNGGNLKLTRNWISNGNTFVVTGNSRSGQKTISVYRPELYFLCTLCDILRKNGVETSGGYGLALCPKSESVCFYTCARTIEQIMQRMMKKSDNLYAESMLYKLAAFNGERWASGKEGIKQIESVVSRAGVPSSYVKVADGSGVSLYNYISPKAEVAMLRYAYKNDRIFRFLYPSLPIAGVDGTLDSRMKNGTAYRNVHAKTGTVTGVVCLAGYCTASNGNLLAFSIMHNGLLKSDIGRAFQDRICQEMTR